MIDTDKYEGHTPAERWAKVVWGKNPRHESKGELPTCLVLLNMDENGKETYATLTDQILMADSPLLLEEVKRLRSIADDLYACIVSDADISDELGIIEKQMDWRNEE
jgi:hypothetical protein